MKLKLVERTNAHIGSTSPKISISTKGSLYVNAMAMALMRIENSAKVKFFQDEEDGQAWYIQTCEDGYASLSKKTKNDGSGQVYVRDIAESIIKSYYHIGKTSLKFELLPAIKFEGLDFYPLKLIKESLKMEIPNPNGK